MICQCDVHPSFTPEKRVSKTLPNLFAAQTVAFGGMKKCFADNAFYRNNCSLRLCERLPQMLSHVLWNMAGTGRMPVPSLLLVSLDSLTLVLKPKPYELLHCKNIQDNGRTCMQGEIQILNISCWGCSKCSLSPYPIDDVSWPKHMI